MKKYIIALSFTFFALSQLFAQTSLLGGFGYGNYLNDKASGMNLQVGINEHLNSNFDLRFSINSFFSEDEGKFAQIKENEWHTLGDSDLKNIFGIFNNQVTHGILVFPSKPDKFSAYSDGVSLFFKPKSKGKNTLNIGAGVGFSYVNSTKIAHLLQPTYLYDQLFGEFDFEENEVYHVIIFQYQRYWDADINLNLEYFKKLNKNLELGLQVNYRYLPFSKNSILSIGTAIKI